MASILDHVTNAVPRATVYGSLRGSNVFTGRMYRSIFPASNAITYDPISEREVKFILASPSKTSFFDMRSVYLKFEIGNIYNTNATTTKSSNNEGL